VWRVTFESSTDGLAYTLLGDGIRSPGGWGLDGMNLPGGPRYIRARGYYSTGGYNSSTSIVETTQLFNLIEPPAITSAASTTFSVGTPSSFTVTATGYPIPTWVISGWLPEGVTFSDNEDSTVTLTGTPAPGSVGVYNLAITASNGVGKDAVQAFTLNVVQEVVTVFNLFIPLVLSE